ncbi:pyridoxamine 5'-phosphate oxidase family protein [Thermostaphylospora chromogena]|uniref:Pyridoxamine 5'-phosphate oxidase n=1 Tax=Thermostaphylospora chromogena TaxID=35622 RepID=A0A1H1BYB0_9ACTN|nr:pyridoxamine 5'-phosphate oxidase family protein [Thermostaphylospora chromogena]SDQ56918.1 Pyridoxamine 5'-phosphate oxidase [Thermostaphylospora chromogena]
MTAPVSTEPLTQSAPTAWHEALKLLAGCDGHWLATRDADGSPHLVPVLAVVVDGTVHFTAGPGTRKARNLARDPRCALGGQSASFEHLVLRGRATIVRDEAVLRRVADAYATRYDWHVTVRDGAFQDTEGAPTAGPPPYEVYALEPATAFGFGGDEHLTSTRWRF